MKYLLKIFILFISCAICINTKAQKKLTADAKIVNDIQAGIVKLHSKRIAMMQASM